VPLESRNHALLAADAAWGAFKDRFRAFFQDAEQAPGALRIRAEFGELTAREIAVVEQVAAGLDNAEVGRRLGVSEKTVRNHLTRVFEKFGVRSRAQLIVRLRGG
jgi:DNA-binding CsgD family transcriptional regulator